MQLPQQASLVKAKRYPHLELLPQVPWAAASSKKPRWLAASTQQNRVTLR